MQVADGGGRRRVEGDRAGGQDRAVEALPLSLADAVLEGVHGRLHLVATHRGQRVDEAVAPVFLAIGGRIQARVVDGGLLAHQIDDLRAREARVRRLHERGDARHVGRRHGRATRLCITAGEQGERHGRVDVLAGGREIDGLTVVGEVSARERRPLGLGLGVDPLDRADLAHARDLAGHADGTRDGTVLDRRVQVRRRAGVGRRMVVVRPLIAGRRDDGQALALRVGDRARRRLQARGLLGVGRAPVHPRVHRVGVVHDVHAVSRRPHESAGHVLGVDQLLGVRGLDGHQGRVRRDTVDADAVVLRSDDAGDVRAVEVVVTPTPVRLGGDAVGRARHGAGLIDAPSQVGVHVVDTRVDNADGHGGMRDGHGRRIGGAHGRGSPIRDLFRPIGRAYRLAASAVHAAGVAARLSAALARGVSRLRGLRRGLRRGILTWVSHLDALALGHGGHTGRSNRVHLDPGARQGLGQVGSERGRLTLGEEGPDLRIRGQGGALCSRNLGEGALQVSGTGSRTQVNRVVHEARAASCGGNEGGGFIGSGWWCGRRRCAHGQGEDGDEPDACNVAAHGSSTFSCR